MIIKVSPARSMAISNGNVTKREVGNSGTSIGLKSCMVRRADRGKFGYISQTKDGRYLKSVPYILKTSRVKY